MPKDSESSDKTQGKVTLPAWVAISMAKGEEVENITESKTSGIGMAVAAALFALIAGAAGFFKDQIAKMVTDSSAKVTETSGMGVGDMTSLGIIALVAVIAFILLMVMGKGKIALVMTSLRSVCVIGKKQLEIKK